MLLIILISRRVQHCLPSSTRVEPYVDLTRCTRGRLSFSPPPTVCTSSTLTPFSTPTHTTVHALSSLPRNGFSTFLPRRLASSLRQSHSMCSLLMATDAAFSVSLAGPSSVQSRWLLSLILTNESGRTNIPETLSGSREEKGHRIHACISRANLAYFQSATVIFQAVNVVVADHTLVSGNA